MTKRIAPFLVLALACFGGAWAAHRVVTPAPQAPGTSLSRYLPAGALLYLHAKNFSALLSEWSVSPEKTQWLQSDNYHVFSESRLFLRLQEVKDRFAAIAGLPPDMNLAGQIAGTESALALYDIGKLQFLYITRRAPAASMQSRGASRSTSESRT